MTIIDWAVLIGTLLFIVGYGVYKTRGSKNVTEYLKGGNSSRWWTIGISVMATQASAITFLSTPGKAFHDGMGFVQFYFGLPLAMVVICLVFIPLYHKLKVFTAYEYLEGRFDLKTRILTAIIFLIQRGIAAGITIYAPSIILSVVLGWDLLTLNIIIGFLVIIYTVSGGTKAVSITQKQQMAVIFGGMFIAFFLILSYLPANISFSDAINIAGANGKMDILDFGFDLENRYTFWSGIIGGGFLALSYFGTDQSQVQRYLSGKSIKESQMGMIMNGFLKVPMQFFILLIGVMVFVFYQFNSSPLHFNPNAEIDILNSEHASEYQELLQKKQVLEVEKRQVQLQYIATADALNKERLRHEISDIYSKEKNLRNTTKVLLESIGSKVEVNDKDYVFIHFIVNTLPIGLIGLLLAVILSAAMSSTASEVNALASTTAIDLYKRNIKKSYSPKQEVFISKFFTVLWGIIAIVVACTANLFESLIELVNIIGSIFYGNVLGIFLLAFFLKFVKGNAAFTAAIINQIIVIALYFLNQYGVVNIPFLWLNFVGCVSVMYIAVFIQNGIDIFNKIPNAKKRLLYSIISLTILLMSIYFILLHTGNL